MKFYAILHKPTGYYLPDRFNHCRQPSKTGFTWMEPRSDCIPRLFKTYQNAKSALWYWLKGKWYKQYNTEMDIYQLLNEFDPSRKPEDMVIIELTLERTSHVTP